MTRAIALALSLAIASPSRATEPVELEAGQAAPFKGALCDKACAAQIAAKINAANALRDECYSKLEARGGTGGAPALLVAGAAFLVGALLGGAVVAIVAK